VIFVFIFVLATPGSQLKLGQDFRSVGN